MARAKSCPSACSPSQQRAIVAQVRKSLAKCGPRKRAKRARARTASPLEKRIASLERFAAGQRIVNTTLAAAVASIYLAAEVPTLPRRAFTVADAKRAARAIGAPARGIPPRQLAAGMTAELEHGTRAGRLDVTHDDPLASARIALAHMHEDRAYYPHLHEMEARAQGVRQLPAPTGAAKPRKARKGRQRVNVEAVEMTVEQLEGDPLAIPQPIGPEGYRPPQCAAHHEPWSPDYDAALEDARERAAIEAGEDEQEYRRLLRAYFAEHPRFADWSAVERECVADFRTRHPRKRRHTVTAADETRAALDEARAELGYDITGSAEHLDRLTLSGQAAYWRRLHKRTGSVDALRRAREIEKRARARRKKGAGVATFAVG